VLALSAAKLDGRIFLSGVMDVEEKQARRIESLLRNIHGMESAKAAPDAESLQRMIALFRIGCDMTDRAEVLHFVSAVHARAVMVRPLWVAFEVVGTPSEVEGIYLSAAAYGIVDVISCSCAVMTSAKDSEDQASAHWNEETEAAFEIGAGEVEAGTPLISARSDKPRPFGGHTKKPSG
jgi:acetolactate synthase small subunit